jgi:hypothetical protein
MEKFPRSEIVTKNASAKFTYTVHSALPSLLKNNQNFIL